MTYRDMAKNIHIFACPTCDGTEALLGGDVPCCAEPQCEGEEMCPAPESVVLAVLVAANRLLSNETKEMSTEGAASHACRCPNRPFYTPGSLGSGSAHELALLDHWDVEHGHHPYAKARDEFAGAIGAAEREVGSGEAVLVMAADILGMPRDVLQKALDAYAAPATPPQAPA